MLFPANYSVETFRMCYPFLDDEAILHAVSRLNEPNPLLTEANIGIYLSHLNDYFARHNPLIEKKQVIEKFVIDRKFLDSRLKAWLQFWHLAQPVEENNPAVTKDNEPVESKIVEQQSTMVTPLLFPILVNSEEDRESLIDAEDSYRRIFNDAQPYPRTIRKIINLMFDDVEAKLKVKKDKGDEYYLGFSKQKVVWLLKINPKYAQSMDNKIADEMVLNDWIKSYCKEQLSSEGDLLSFGCFGSIHEANEKIDLLPIENTLPLHKR